MWLPGGCFRRRLRSKKMWKVDREEVIAAVIVGMIIWASMEMLVWAVTGSYIGR